MFCRLRALPLATLSLDALAAGTSFLIYDSLMLGDSWGEPLMVVAMSKSGEVGVASAM